MITQPHRFSPLVESDYLSSQTMRGWIDSITEEVNGRFVVGEEWIIRSLQDFKDRGAVFAGDEIHIPEYTTLAVKARIDISPYRIVFDGVGAIRGSNAETAGIYSNLSSGAMIKSVYLLNIVSITLSTGANAYCVEIDGTGNPSAVADWYGVNFTAGKAAKLTSMGNFISVSTGLLNPDNGFDIFGTFGTFAIEGSIVQLTSGTGKIAVNFDSAVEITRRIRFNFSSFVVTSGNTALKVPLAITIPDDTYIIFFCNFSGGGTYVDGIQNTSLKTRWYQNRGISNTYRAGQFYIENNATSTTIGSAGTYVKLAGATTANPINVGFSHTSNRLTCTSVVTKLYKIAFSVTFTSGAADVVGFKVYKNGSEVLGTKVRATANPAGRAENVGGNGIVELALGDYLEIWTTNETLPIAVTGVDYSMLVTESE